MYYFIYPLSFFLIGALSLTASRWRFWWLKILDAMRLQIVVCCVLVITWILWFSDFTVADISIMLVMVGLIFYRLPSLIKYTHLSRKEIRDAIEGGPMIQCIAVNVRMKNSDYDRLTDLVIEEQPDLLLLTEVNQEWIEGVKVLEKMFLHKVLVPQSNTYGMALYSKWPLVDPEVKYLVEDDIPSIHTFVDGPGTVNFQFIGLHPKPPAPSNHADLKDLELVKTAGMINENSNPTLVSGDLNDVAWSKATRQFKAISGLKDPRIGRGFFNTYNVFFPLFRMPIDHFFVSKVFEVQQLKRLKAIGSDHFPVKISLVYKGK